MNDSPLKNDNEGKSEEDFFSFPSVMPRKSGVTAKIVPESDTKEKKEDVVHSPSSPTQKVPHKSDPLKTKSSDVDSPLLDLSKNKFSKPNPTLPLMMRAADSPKMKSDTIGNVTPFKASQRPKQKFKNTLKTQSVAIPVSHEVEIEQRKTAPERIDRYHEPIEDVSKNINPNLTEDETQQPKTDVPHADVPSQHGIKEEKTRPERPDKYHEPIEELIPPVVDNSENEELAKRLMAVGDKIRQIETAMPTSYPSETSQTSDVVPMEKEIVDETGHMMTVNRDEAERAVIEISGYIEMLGGVESRGKLLEAEEIADIARNIFLGKHDAKISDIPTDSGVQALVMKFANELGATLK
ncbi:MAG: hypothetical protein ISR99_00385 [Parcubacteria group bacterium]|nr:hypothetical protein [Parcubacteria group bacterium]